MQDLAKKELDALKAEASDFMEQVSKLDPEDRRVVLAALRGMIIALEK